MISGSVRTASTVGELRRKAVDVLQAAGIANPIREADWLLASALGVSPLTLVLERERRVTRPHAERAWNHILRRAAHEPLQYLLGTQEFRGLDMTVTPNVLIPRPETEILVEETLLAVAGLPRPVIADVGTGSGCIAVSVARERPTAAIFAMDISSEALSVARSNARRHGVQSVCRFVQADLLEACSISAEGTFDVIVSNPPYIPDEELGGLQPEVARYEPYLALAAGSDGLAYHRRILKESPPLLKPGGYLILELGFGQAEAVSRMACVDGVFAAVGCREDAAGIKRVLVARKVV